MHAPRYFSGYPEHLQSHARDLLAGSGASTLLRERYADPHAVRNDKQLYDYTLALKDRYLRSSVPLGKVLYDNHLQVVKHALGTHTSISRVHGRKLKASREIRIASVFRDAPAAFLQMIVVHELAHLKESEHNKAFYQLCTHMAPDYHRLEFDLRLYLSVRDAAAAAPTGNDAPRA